MKKFDSKLKNAAYRSYSVVAPVFDPIKFFQGIFGYFWFFGDFFKSKEKKSILEIFPQLHDKTTFTPFDSQYYYQQLWVFENVFSRKPQKHVDIASTYELSGYIAKVTKSVFVDYRPIPAKVPNLEVLPGDILNLPFEDQALESVSCLHVIEHIGLGRYGDPINEKGLELACKELQRVLAKDGFLYLSTPVGKKKLYFNAHRVSSPKYIAGLFDELELANFGAINDNGEYIENAKIEDFENSNYSCGLFLFTRK